jgi:hypothetical protein
MAGFSYGALAKDYARLWHAMKIPPGVLAPADARVRAIARGRLCYDQSRMPLACPGS